MNTYPEATHPDTQTMSYQPAFDLLETPSGLILRADVPGVKPGGVDLSIDRGELRLLAKVGRREAEGRRLVEEYGVGDYHLQVRLPGPVDPTTATAALANGVLTVTLLRPEEMQPRRIPVQATRRDEH